MVRHRLSRHHRLSPAPALSSVTKPSWRNPRTVPRAQTRALAHEHNLLSLSLSRSCCLHARWRRAQKKPYPPLPYTKALSRQAGCGPTGVPLLLGHGDGLRVCAAVWQRDSGGDGAAAVRLWSVWVTLRHSHLWLPGPFSATTSSLAGAFQGLRQTLSKPWLKSAAMYGVRRSACPRLVC